MYIGLPVLVKADVGARFGYLFLVMLLLLETSETSGVQQKRSVPIQTAGWWAQDLLQTGSPNSLALNGPHNACSSSMASRLKWFSPGGAIRSARYDKQ